jgi:hypothetical protein
MLQINNRKTIANHYPFNRGIPPQFEGAQNGITQIPG